MEDLKLEDAGSVGDYIAFYCGDTFIRFDDLTPAQQWERIIEMLNEEGFYIVEKWSELILLEKEAE